MTYNHILYQSYSLQLQEFRLQIQNLNLQKQTSLLCVQNTMKAQRIVTSPIIRHNSPIIGLKHHILLQIVLCLTAQAMPSGQPTLPQKVH